MKLSMDEFNYEALRSFIRPGGQTEQPVCAKLCAPRDAFGVLCITLTE
jgi:hypothetical protein